MPQKKRGRAAYLNGTRSLPPLFFTSDLYPAFRRLRLLSMTKTRLAAGPRKTHSNDRLPPTHILSSDLLVSFLLRHNTTPRGHRPHGTHSMLQPTYPDSSRRSTSAHPDIEFGREQASIGGRRGSAPPMCSRVLTPAG